MDQVEKVFPQPYLSYRWAHRPGSLTAVVPAQFPLTMDGAPVSNSETCNDLNCFDNISPDPEESAS